MKTLIIYYSLEGSCRFTAERIAEALGADLLELKPLRSIKGERASKYFWGGRKVALFCCHDGGMGKTLENMENALPQCEVIGRADFMKENKDNLNAVIGSWVGEILKSAEK